MSNLTKILRKNESAEYGSLPPIWFMRQAGRYLPEYMEIRNKLSNFLELCYTPKLASEVTLQPIRRFGFDAAIIFSDILVLPHTLGWDLEFMQGEGPVLRQFTCEDDFKYLHDQPSSLITNIYETVSLVREHLNRETSLIGFAGSPWTVMSYMLEGKGKQDFSTSKKFLYNNRDLAIKLVNYLADQTIDYLSNQIKAGADVIQLFDSWAGQISGEEFTDFVIAPTKKIVTTLKDIHPDVPIIGFPRAAGFMYDNYINNTGVDAVGVDQFVPLEKMKQWQEKIVVQGNLDPICLFASKEVIEHKLNEILTTLNSHNFIFNLGHGILPSTPIENVQFVIDYIRSKKNTV